MDDIFDLVAGTLNFDRQVSKSAGTGDPELTFRRDENGILWSFDVKTGKKVGRIFEHGDDSKFDTIKEI